MERRGRRIALVVHQARDGPVRRGRTPDRARQHFAERDRRDMNQALIVAHVRISAKGEHRSEEPEAAIEMAAVIPRRLQRF